MLLLPQMVAAEFVQECGKRNIRLLGYDVFRLLPGDRIQPIMDHGLDLSAELYSDLSQREGLALAAHLLLESLNEDVWFEMITD